MSGEEGLDEEEDKGAARFWISLFLKQRRAPSVESYILEQRGGKPRMSY